MASAEYTLIHGRSDSFYHNFDRKADLQHTTHYCPGCGHGIAQKLIAEAIDELGIQDRTIFVSPVGCSVFAYYYFDVGNVQAAHGRASAVATAVKRTRPESIVLGYQGDGDLAAIGTAEILHAANRGENITVFFINNAIYGMTGGQLAPTTLLGTKTTTSPRGRDPLNEGYPLHVAELLATLEGPAYIERVALGDNKGIMQAAKAVRKAIRNQMDGLGFSLVEIVSPCPTVWKMDPLDAQRYVREELVKVFPPGVYLNRAKTQRRVPHLRPRLSSAKFREFWVLLRTAPAIRPHRNHPRTMWISVFAWPVSAARACCCWARFSPKRECRLGCTSPGCRPTDRKCGRELRVPCPPHRRPVASRPS